MKVSEFAHTYLFDNGLMVSESVAVVELAKQDELLKDIKWDEDTDAYPAPFLQVFLVSLNAVTVKWIDANIPQAWFRSIFEPQQTDQSDHLDQSDKLDPDYKNVINSADQAESPAVG